MSILCHLCKTRRSMKNPTEVFEAAVANNVDGIEIVAQKFAFTSLSRFRFCEPWVDPVVNDDPYSLLTIIYVSLLDRSFYPRGRFLQSGMQPTEIFARRRRLLS